MAESEFRVLFPSTTGAPGDGEISGTRAPFNNSSKRANVSTACENCRVKRRKCDNRHPCEPCVLQNIACTRHRRDRRRQAEKRKVVDDLQAEVTQLQQWLKAIRSGTEEEALSILQQLRTKETYPSSASEVSPWSPEADKSPSPYDEIGWTSNLQLPQRDATYVSIKRCLDTVGSVFYLADTAELDDIFEHVYSSHAQHPPASAAEFFSLAALGKLFDPDYLQATNWHTFYKIAVTYAHDCIAREKLSAMRTFALLAIHDVIEKRNSARFFIGSGLRIARGEMRDEDAADVNFTERERHIYDLLVLLECCVAASCGYRPDILGDEIQRIRTDIDMQVIDDLPKKYLARHLMLQIGILKFDVLQAVHPRGPLDYEVVDKLMGRLEEWRQKLPGFMQLSTLINPDPNAPFEVFSGCMLVVHSFFLSAVMSLHRRAVVELAEWYLGGHWTLSSPPDRVQRCHDICVEAARSVIRVFMLLGFGYPEKCPLHVRCWLVGFNVVDSTSMILHDILQKIALWHLAGVEDDINRLDDVFAMLTVTLRCDHVSRKMAQRLIPVFESVKNVYEQERFVVKQRQSGDYSAAMTDGSHRAIPARSQINQQARSLSETVLEILQNPYPRDEGMTWTTRDASNWWNSMAESQVLEATTSSGYE